MTQSEPIAIIGMSGRFPKAPTLDGFWEILRTGAHVFEQVPDIMMDSRRDAAGNLPAKYVPIGAYLEDTEYFDCDLFGIGRREAQIMDPQVRLFLEQSWAAAEDAGYDVSRISARTAVYAGAGPSRHALDALEVFGHDSATMFEVIATGIDKPMSMRASHIFDLKGESLYVYAACATSLVAIDMAINGLRTGRADAAIAGASVLYLPQMEGYDYAEGAVRSPDGLCRPFDAKAAGTNWGPGVGVVILKRLSDAKRDGDRIRAVLAGTFVNNDGSAKQSFAAPSIDGQAEVVAGALADAGLSAGDVDFVEAHGTGTKVGDPIEVSSLNRIFAGARARDSMVLGSVKGNIGHLDPAAGIAGLIKTVLALEHEEIPPTALFHTPNPNIPFADGPFRVTSEPTAWSRGPRRRVAGVNSFGVGGTNAHLVVVEAPEAASRTAAERPQVLVTLSAQSEQALVAAAQDLVIYLGTHPQLELRDISYTRNTGRRELPVRCAVAAASVEELTAALPGAVDRSRMAGRAPRVAFVFPGQGSQCLDMAGDIYATEPVYRTHFDSCAAVLQDRLGVDILDLVFPQEGDEERATAHLRETRLQQPILFCVSYALGRLFESWGVIPELMIGHSLGEYVCAALAGIMSAEEALVLLCVRGKAMQDCAPGAMLAVMASADVAQAHVPEGLDLAGMNGKANCVLGGPLEVVDAAVAQLEDAKLRHRRLNTSHAFHTRMMEPARVEIAEAVACVTPRPSQRAWVSTVTGDIVMAGQTHDTALWTRQIVEPVRFNDAVNRAVEHGIDTFLELGAQPILGALVQMEHPQCTVLSVTASAGAPAAASLHLDVLADLWMRGQPVDWEGYHRPDAARRVSLPAYPFQKTWVALTPEGVEAQAPHDPLKGWPSPQAALQQKHAAAYDAPRNPRPDHLLPPYAAPADALESDLAEMFSRILGITPVGREDDILDLGWSSIMLVHAANQLRDALEINVPIQTIADNMSVASLAIALRADFPDVLS